MDDKQGVLYGAPCLGIGHRSSYPEDPGGTADCLESAGSHLSVISGNRREGRCGAVHRRDRGRGGILSDQQSYEGRNRVWRQLDDPDTWNLSWGVGDSGGAGRDVSFAGGSFCDLPDSKEDVPKLRASLRAVLGGGISAACNLCGKVILQPKMRLYCYISPYTAVRTGVMKRKSAGS